LKTTHKLYITFLLSPMLMAMGLTGLHILLMPYFTYWDIDLALLGTVFTSVLVGVILTLGIGVLIYQFTITYKSKGESE